MSAEDATFLVRSHVGQRVVDYLRVNGLSEEERRLRGPEETDQGSNYIVTPAEATTAGPNGIVLLYDKAGCELTLPAGRQFRFGRSGGFMEEIEGILPLEPLAWQRMQAQLGELVASLDSSGWRRSTGRYTPNQPVRTSISPEDFANKSGPKWAAVGFWEACDDPSVKLYLEVRHYESSASGSFTPPTALAVPTDPMAEDRFLFLVRIQAEYGGRSSDEFIQLRDERRRSVTGDPGRPLPASVWLDDPDWRPPNESRSPPD